MTDYHSPTVVTPSIPVSDMTSLERLLLRLVFDENTDGTSSNFHAWFGPREVLTIAAIELRTVWEESRDRESRINNYVGKLIAEFSATAEVERSGDIGLDLTGPDEDWVRMFQDIVRRSQTLDEIVITAAFTCSEMRPDSFGGSVMRVTADTTQYASTVEMLEDMRDAHAVPDAMKDNAHATRQRILAIADAAGWDSFTLLLLVARWLERSSQTEVLIDFLDRLAGDGDC